MKPETATKLAEALRSGKYKQCTGVLRSGDCYCVMGVMADISGLGEWDGDTYVCGDEKLNKELAYKQLEQLGIEDWEQSEFTSCNDEGLTFDELAKMAEEFAKPISFMDVVDYDGKDCVVTYVEDGWINIVGLDDWQTYYVSREKVNITNKKMRIVEE